MLLELLANFEPQCIVNCFCDNANSDLSRRVSCYLCLIWLSSWRLWFHMFRQWCGHTSLSNTLDKWSNNKLLASIAFLGTIEKPIAI